MSARLRLGQRVEVPAHGITSHRIIDGEPVRGTTIGRVRALESDRVQVETAVRLEWWPLALVRPAPLGPRLTRAEARAKLIAAGLPVGPLPRSKSPRGRGVL